MWPTKLNMFISWPFSEKKFAYFQSRIMFLSLQKEHTFKQVNLRMSPVIEFLEKIQKCHNPHRDPSQVPLYPVSCSWAKLHLTRLPHLTWPWIQHRGPHNTLAFSSLLWYFLFLLTFWGSVKRPTAHLKLSLRGSSGPICLTVDRAPRCQWEGY